MPTLIEENLACIFPDDWAVTKYDEWAFYWKRFIKSCCDNKAVDFLAYNPEDRTLWLIELKDYRYHPRTKKLSLWEEIALKARDTLAGLFAAKINTAHADHPYAVRALRATGLRVVLHLEQPRTYSKLFPRAYDRALVQQKLKQILKPIDDHPIVVELSAMNTVPWNARSHPPEVEP